MSDLLPGADAGLRTGNVLARGFCLESRDARAGTRDSEIRSVRIADFELRIANFSMTIVDQFAIRNSQFAIRNFMILSGWESVFFWIFSIAAILAALLTVMARNAVHSALFLISSLMSVAALFFLLGAVFIAGVQILVYVGGVMVLFLFVIMLVNVGAEEEGKAAIFNRTPQVAAALVFSLLLVLGLLLAINKGFGNPKEKEK